MSEKQTRGRSEKYTKELLSLAVAECYSVAEVLRYLECPSTGGNMHFYISNRIKYFSIDTSHFVKNGLSPQRKKKIADSVLSLNEFGSSRKSASALRNALIQNSIPEQCSVCGNKGEWMGQLLTLEVDHIDGNNLDNRLTNLRFICPNCHSQTPTYRSKNIKSKNSSNYKNSMYKKNYCVCGNIKHEDATICFKCHRKEAPTKIEWPSRLEVLTLVKKTNYTEAGKILGVTDNTVRKFLNRTREQSPAGPEFDTPRIYKVK